MKAQSAPAAERPPAVYPTRHTAAGTAGTILGMDKVIDVAIVGAGPYGLSVAAHLRKFRVEFRIFGGSGSRHARVRRDLQLEVESSCLNLSDPDRRFTLSQYCREHGLSRADRGERIALKTFLQYRQAFQQRLVPTLERKTVLSVARTADSFALRLDDGQVLKARQVVVATGANGAREASAHPTWPRWNTSQPQPRPVASVASHFVAGKPLLFHSLPDSWRSSLLRASLDPQAVPAEVAGDSVAAPLALLDSEIVTYLRCADRAPVLSSNFQSTMAGLYFVGALATGSFGPAMQQASGTGFAAPRLSRHLDQRAWFSLLAGTAD